MDLATRRPGRRAAAAMLLAVAWLAAAAAGSAVLAADENVAIRNLAFSPRSVTVGVGDAVTWTNSDSLPHTATGDGGEFHTGNVDEGDSGSVTFDSAGTFAYHCEIHPQMTGTVVVEAAATGATNPPTDAVPPPGPPTSDAPGLPASLLVVVGASLASLAALAWAHAKRPRSAENR